jgi:hypothetical protein
MKSRFLININVKQFIIAVVLTGAVSLCFVEFFFSPSPKTIAMKSSNDCVDDLLDRYHSGYFTAARHSVSPVTMTEDSETIRLRNQILELAYENSLLKQDKQENHRYILQLLETKRELVQIRSSIDKQEETPHAAIDQLLFWIRNELKRNEVETELDEILYLEEYLELRNEEDNNG